MGWRNFITMPGVKEWRNLVLDPSWIKTVNCIQYVDDTNNVIFGNNAAEIEKYSNGYFKLIEGFYTINTLKLNPDKTRLMVVCRPKKREDVKNFVLKAGDYLIEQKEKIK